MKTQKLSATILAAAERVAALPPRDSYSCSAIEDACLRIGDLASHEEDELVARYTYYFKPHNAVSDIVWLQYQFDTEEEKQEWRLTALCFFAAMLEEEGR